MILLDGKSLSQKILSGINISPSVCLHIILVGHNPASELYVAIKEKKCREIGLKCLVHRLEETVSQSDILSLITSLNDDPSVTGFFVQLPLPPHFNQPAIVQTIAPHKDVDGLNPNSGVLPAVVKGIIRLLDEYHLNFENKKVVVINDSQLIGQPLKTVFEKRRANVELLNDKTVDIKTHTLTADLLISATGVKNMVNADMIKSGAVVVDAASGDVDFQLVSEKCSYLTPTFGGVGPMTVASLIQSTIDLSNLRKI